MASDDACVQLAGGPVVDETTGMQQSFQQADEAVIMQFEAGDAALSDECGSGQCGEFTRIDCAGQQLSLLGEASLIGGREPEPSMWPVALWVRSPFWVNSLA
jgi:hypothetical protein